MISVFQGLSTAIDNLRQSINNLIQNINWPWGNSATRLVNIKVVESRIKSPADTEIVIQSAGNSLKFNVKSGIENGGTRIHYFLISPELKDHNLTIVPKNGDSFRVSSTNGYLRLDLKNVNYITIDGIKYYLSPDAWQNIIISDTRPGIIISPQNQQQLEKIINLWEAAIKGDKELDEFLTANLDTDTINEIKDILALLKQNPELQRHADALSQIDVWQLAELGTRAAIKDYLLTKIHFGLLEGEVFNKIMVVVDKVRENTPLTAEDTTLLNTIAVANIAVRESIHNRSTNTITPINERYVVANLAENYLARALVPQGVFQVHQSHFRDFKATMAARGVIIPDWFTAYRGEEFAYGPAIRNTIANAGGNYVFDVTTASSNFMARIFDHERVHTLVLLAKEMSGFTPETVFRSEEAFTDALALLIKYNGDVDAALNSPNIRDTSYSLGVEALLDIVKEININAGGDITGVRLMLDGVLGIASGANKGTLEPLIAYYDSRNVGNGISFATKMAPFSDTRYVYMGEGYEIDPALPKTKIKQIINGFSYEEARVAGASVGSDYFERRKQVFIEYPTFLLSGTQETIKDLILQRVLKNPEATSEMRGLVGGIYSGYIKAIKRRMEDILVKAQPN